MNEILNLAIACVAKAEIAYCKFITSNDAGATGGHQYGFHIHKSAWRLGFEVAGIKGSNKENFVTIKWQNDFNTESRFIYYGTGTRNEYRLTRFGNGFPFLNDENIGNLLILCKIEGDNYEAYVLNSDAEIETFLAAVGIDVTETNQIIPKGIIERPTTLESYFEQFISTLETDFPPSIQISNAAREIFNQFYGHQMQRKFDTPDKTIVGWLDIEFQLFKSIENKRYSNLLRSNFVSIDQLIEISNTILNRRKSRAGKSLENHLAAIFTKNDLRFETQVVTEGNKKPDFIFPGSKEYHDLNFVFENLTFLGAKTTCKDRWRQILNEAARIPNKHLFTLQQGISSNQLDEMKNERVTLVVPKEYFESFPKKYREDLMSLESFIAYIRFKQEN